MFRPVLLSSVIASAMIMAPAFADGPTAVHSVGAPYAAGQRADRIVLTPGQDTATQMAVTFRTDLAQPTAELELAPALAGPLMGEGARKLSGTTRSVESENGAALYHQVRLTDLMPDTPYVYRVKGSAGWTEWHPFRTARQSFAPFTFIYLGDTQNDILSIASRTIRQALRSVARPSLVIHAGDLVAQGDKLVHDDEWGEWNEAGGYAYASIPQLPAAGNHEYLDTVLPDGKESRRLGPHFPAQFALPRNGAQGAADTSYAVDHQGVRFIVLDGTSALELGTLESQTRWLETTLRESRSRWRIVIMHQPMFTCARPQDTEELKLAWKPLFERYSVDLVLQGHDHCYSRLTNAAGRKQGASAERNRHPVGPVYMVSVTGSKMYGLNDRAHEQPDRVAEDTQLYQTVTVENDSLAVRAYSADDRLYDAFDVRRGRDGKNYLHTPVLDLPAERFCRGTTGPDGLRCTSRDK